MFFNPLVDTNTWHKTHLHPSSFTIPLGLVGHETLPLELSSPRHLVCLGGRGPTKSRGVVEKGIDEDK